MQDGSLIPKISSVFLNFLYLYILVFIDFVGDDLFKHLEYIKHYGRVQRTQIWIEVIYASKGQPKILKDKLTLPDTIIK